MGRVIVVTGTGTGVGKTHVAAALLWGLRRVGSRAVGYKPVETGVADGVPSDADRLSEASTFHVQHARHTFPMPVSPHLAVRAAGAPPIGLTALADSVSRLSQAADDLVVELAGGLFTPLTNHATNAELISELKPTGIVLVAVDRLGALHDVLCAVRAASTVPLALDTIVLSAPAHSDASTGTNCAELARMLPHTSVWAVPRADVNGVSSVPALAAWAKRITTHSSPARP